MSPRVELCVYCGEREGTEEEHAIGRLFFPKPHPGDMVKVPACSVCNRGISKDEEYVRAVLLAVMDTEGSGAAQRVRAGKLRRSFERDEGRGLAKRIRASIEWVRIVTPSGLVLPKKVPLIAADADRLNRVFIKIIVGLYYHQKQKRLPSDHEVLVYMPGEGEPLRELLPLAIRFVAERGVLNKIGDGSCFVYWLRDGEERPNQTFWLMSFYAAVPILAATRPKEDP